MKKMKLFYVVSGILFATSLLPLFLSSSVFAENPITPPVTPPTTVPTPTVAPTATPIVTNNAPIITTNKLPIGLIYRQYTANFAGHDLDINDSLRIAVTGLPEELNNIYCTSYVLNNKKNIQCAYSGTPKKAGIYEVVAKITDQKERTTTKTFSLFMLPF